MVRLQIRHGTHLVIDEDSLRSLETIDPTPLVEHCNAALPSADEIVRIVCIPDTHGGQDKVDLPAGHVLIHAGVRKTDGCRQTAYMGCPFSKAAEAIIAGFDMDGTKMVASW